MAKKFDAQFAFKMTSESKDALERIAKAKNADAQELVRRAVYAIIEYAELRGDDNVPLDMEISALGAPSETVLRVTEEVYQYLKEAERKEEERKNKK